MSKKEIPSMPGYFATEDGRIFHKDLELKQQTTPKGYKTIYASAKCLRVHRLVLETFVGPCVEGFEASHLNGKSCDNRAENLKWESRQDNHERKREHGTILFGERNPLTKFTEAKVLTILGMYRKGNTYQQIATELGLSKSHVGSLVRGSAWEHVQRSPLKRRGFQAGMREGEQNFICHPIDHCEGETITEEFLQNRYADYLKTLSIPSQGGEEKAEACEWSKERDDTDTWQSDCGVLWSFIDDGPAGNGMIYCHKCGKPIEVKG